MEMGSILMAESAMMVMEVWHQKSHQSEEFLWTLPIMQAVEYTQRANIFPQTKGLQTVR